MVAVDLGHSHFIELWVLRLLYSLEGLNYSADVLLSVKVQSTPASVSLNRLEFRVNQIVAVKSTVF